MTSLASIEKLVKDFSEARGKLGGLIKELDDEMAHVRRKYIHLIKRSAVTVTEKHSKLFNAVEGSPKLFKKPKTFTMHGIKFGFKKGKGEVKWDNKDQVILLIKKHLADQVEALIETKESPIKKAILRLSGDKIEKIGVTVTGTGSQVLIKTTDSEIDKFIKNLLEKDEVKMDKEAV